MDATEIVATGEWRHVKTLHPEEGKQPIFPTGSGAALGEGKVLPAHLRGKVDAHDAALAAPDPAGVGKAVGTRVPQRDDASIADRDPAHRR